MKWIAVLCMFFMLTSCFRNGRDALESHQIITEPCKRYIHWSEEEPVDVTAEKQVKHIKSCQQFS
ncbi:MAG: hypothetical protein QNK11_08175 [Legionella sp.]|nr:hypothetical protein [Legionella sp.]